MPIEAVAKLAGRLDDFILQCLETAAPGDPNGPALLLALKGLSNEITWLGVVMQALGAGLDDQQQIKERYRSFKIHLTGSRTVALSQAFEVAWTMRSDCLRIRWKLCKHILDNPDEAASFTEASDSRDAGRDSGRA